MTLHYLRRLHSLFSSLVSCFSPFKPLPLNGPADVHALMTACRNDDLAMVRTLVEYHGVDINGRHKRFGGLSPLHACIYIKATPSMRVLRWLVRHGADVRAHTFKIENDYLTPLQLAAFDRHHKALRLLWKSYGPMTSTEIHDIQSLVARRGDVSVLRFIAKKAPFNGNWRDGNGNTLLHLVTSSSNYPETTAQWLLSDQKYRSWVNTKNLKGETPLHLACSRDRRKLATVLLENGADGGVWDGNGCSPYARIPLDTTEKWADLQAASVSKERDYLTEMAAITTEGVALPVSTGRRRL